jgi:RHS repeat-associated protein
VLEGRTFSSQEYRYGFQAQEQDDELWEGAVNYKYRVEDPRLGRFFSVDPLYRKYSWNSNYAFSENRLIDGVELEGCEYVSYALAQTFGGVGAIQLEISSSAGLILGGLKLQGSVGLVYDSKRNFALSASYGAFGDLFSVLGTDISLGGNPKENGSFELGWTILQGAVSEAYYFGFDNVLDTKGAATTVSAQVSAFDLIGVSGSAIYCNNEIVGVSIAGSVGAPFGSPVEASNTTTYSSLAAFNVNDLICTYNAFEGISNSMTTQGIQDYRLQIIERQAENGYMELLWQSTYVNVNGETQTQEWSTSVKYKDVGDSSVATERVINSNQ